MGMTKDEFSAAQVATAKAEAKKPEVRRELAGMLRDAVAAEYLTGDEKWDRFLEWCAGALREIHAAMRISERILLDPRTVAHDDIMRTKVIHAGLEGQARALLWIMETPKALRDGAAQVRALLAEEPKP